MRAYGHLHGVDENAAGILELQSIVIEADEAFLAALRDFAQYALDDMRRLGGRYDYVHFQDKCKVWRDSWPDIVLTKQNSNHPPEAV